jgi:preprotein translocase subunit YajC
MDANNLSTILAQATQSQQQQPGMGDLFRSLVPMIIILFGFFYIMNRSQKKRAREHDELLKSVKPGDKVLTTGGVIGVVITVKEKSLTLRSADTKIEVTKPAITEVLARSSDTTES